MITKTAHALLSSSFQRMDAQKTQLPYGGSERSECGETSIVYISQECHFDSGWLIQIAQAGFMVILPTNKYEYYHLNYKKNTNNIHSCVLIHKIKINLKPLRKHINRGKTNVNKNQQYK